MDVCCLSLFLIGSSQHLCVDSETTTASVPFLFLPQPHILFLRRVHGRPVVFRRQSKQRKRYGEETLALKRTNHEKLIRNMDKAIRNEMLKYEEAEFYIRLQSECFNLYPIVIKALALQIIDNKRRSIFCSIVKGHKLKRLADFHKQTPEEIAIEFRSIVCELRRKINNGAFTAKESVNLRLKMERDILEHKIQDYDELCQRLQLKNKILHDQLDMLRDNQKRHSKDEQEITHEKEQEIIRKTRKALLEELQRKMEIQIEEQTKNLHHESFIMRCMQWLKNALRLPTVSH